MRISKWCGLSASTTLAWLALFVSLGGTSLAASNYVITSTKQIRPSVLRALRGASGPAGLRGLVGSIGPRGSAGGAGAQGVTGATGPEGKEGKAGATGATGPEAGMGGKGATGATGPQGKEGKAGATGAIGPEGGTGGKGATGATGPEGKEGARGEAGAGAPPLWAVVTAAGELVRGGTGSLEAEKIEAGLYEVTFNRDVSKCAYIVSLGNANGALGVHGTADASGGTTPEGADSVSVETTNATGVKTAEPFHLAVFC
jgi:hypothetical protein